MLLAVLVGLPGAASGLGLLAAERSVLSDASGISQREFDEQSDDVVSGDAGGFDAMASAEVSIDDVAGFGFASQQTDVEAGLVAGRGSAGASGFGATPQAFGDFAGEALLRVEIEDETVQRFVLAGSLSASAGGHGDAFATIVLQEIGGDVLFSRDVVPGESETFDAVGHLEAGTAYELFALARSVAAHEGLASADAASGFVVSFALPEPGTAPLALAAIASVLGLRGRRAPGAARAIRRGFDA